MTTYKNYRLVSNSPAASQDMQNLITITSKAQETERHG